MQPGQFTASPPGGLLRNLVFKWWSNTKYFYFIFLWIGGLLTATVEPTIRLYIYSPHKPVGHMTSGGGDILKTLQIFNPSWCFTWTVLWLRSGKYLLSGDTEGGLSVWDTQTAPPDGEEGLLQPQLRFQAHWDCTNGIRCAFFSGLWLQTND